jgi:hypothetical protein
MISSVIRTRVQNPWHTIRNSRGMKMHNPSAAHRTCATEGVTTARDVVLVLKEQG